MQRPDWSKADWDKAREQLKDRSWKNEINNLGAADAWARFRNKIEAVVKDCVPLRKPRSANRPPWMTT
jgi:hypothetical protein